MKRIGIVGVGWLGEELCKCFSSEKVAVVGTVSSDTKAKRLSDSNTSVIQFRLGDSLDELGAFKQLDYIIFTIPPSSHQNYAHEVPHLFKHFHKDNKDAVFIYMSSTSIYGNRVRIVDEKSEVSPSTSNALKINVVEGFIFNNIIEQGVVIRLAGLVGGERHPVNFLSGRKGIQKPFAPVNLIHRDDVVAFVRFIVDQKLKSGVFNLCCEDHPTKKDFYEWAAKEKQRTIPQFNEADKLEDKTVICSAIKKIGFVLKYKSPYDFPR